MEGQEEHHHLLQSETKTEASFHGRNLVVSHEAQGKVSIFDAGRQILLYYFYGMSSELFDSYIEVYYCIYLKKY